MAVEIRVPPLGESLVDAVVGAWLKQEGDAVARGDSLVELETDKVNLDVTAEEDGVLARIDRREGDVVAVGEVLGLVGSSNGASAPAPAAPIAQPVSAAVPERVEAPAPTPAALIAPPPAAAISQPQPPAPAITDDGDLQGGGRAAPAVRRLAEEHNIDLNNVVGTGPGGRSHARRRLDRRGKAGRTGGAAATPAGAAPAPAVSAPPPRASHARRSAGRNLVDRFSAVAPGGACRRRPA